MELRRIIKIWILAIMIVAAFSCMITAFADDSESVNGFWVLSDECPEEYYEYIIEHFDGFIYAIEPGDYTCRDNYSLGSPFNIGADKSTFYFPVLNNGEIKYLIWVYPDVYNNSLAGAISKEMVKGLKEIQYRTSITEPLYITSSGNKLLGFLGRSEPIELLDLYGATEKQESFTNTTNDYCGEKLTVNILSDILPVPSHITGEMIDAYYVEQDIINSTRELPTYYYLDTEITEHQTSLPWCAAYATAMIVRYRLNDSTTALNVMQHFYSNPGPGNTIGEYAVCQYGAYRGLNPVYTAFTMLKPVLQHQIALLQPVYLRMSVASGGYHAIVLRGYSQSGSYLSVWNPWDASSYTGFYYGLTYQPIGHTSAYAMTYVETVYNWMTYPEYPE